MRRLIYLAMMCVLYSRVPLVEAIEVSCTAAVNPAVLVDSEEYDAVEVRVTNTGGNFIYWIKIIKPAGLFWDYERYGPPGDFEVYDYGDYLDFVTQMNEFYPETQVAFMGDVDDGHGQVLETDWVVEASSAMAEDV